MNVDTLMYWAQQFLTEKVTPLELRLIHEGPNQIAAELEALREEVKRKGYFSPHMPEEYGSLHLKLNEFARLSELLGQSPLGHYLFNCQAPDIGNMELLLAHGTEAQKERWLKPLANGEIRSCFSMTEPEYAGSNPVRMDTTAVIDGDDYVINGHKWFTSSADGASFAIVMAKTNPNADKPHKAFSQIIVPTNTPGFELVRNIPVMGETGEGYFSHAEIRYHQCRVPRSNLLGKEGEGFVLAQERLGPGRIHHCMRWIGICERALKMMCQRAQSRELSSGQRLIEKQTIAHMIADSRTEIHASRLMVLHAAKKIDSLGTRQAREEISMIKFYVAGVLQKVLDRAIQIHGALGMSDDTLLAYWFRHERGARIYDGPDEIHKSVVTRFVMKRYAEEA